MNTLPEKEYLSINEVSAWLHVTYGEVYATLKRRDFPVCRFGRIIRIPRKPFLGWLDAHLDEQSAPGCVGM